MLIVNTPQIPGKKIEALSLVTGVCIMCKHLGKDIKAGFRNLFGGEMKGYSDMLNESKDIALKRLEEAAESLGADAVINVRFTTSSIIQGGAEILACGTAVKFIEGEK